MAIMNSWIRRFNTYLLMAVFVGVPTSWAADTAKPKSGAGATVASTNATSTNTALAKPEAAPKKSARQLRREKSTFTAHIETQDVGTQWCLKVQVDRQFPITLTVDRTPVLEEEHVDHAEVIDVIGGFALKITLTERGASLLDAASASYRGLRLAVFSNFGQDRWLGAPIMNQRIRNGVLIFTPDATREEAERMVNGLNNVAAKIKKNSFF